MTNTEQHTIQVKCDLSSLKEIRAFIDERLSLMINDKERNLIVLAVDEVCANLIIHSNEGNAEAVLKISLKIENSPDGILFEIYDTGKYFNYEEYEEPHFEEVVREQRKGSIGLILVRRIMDKVEFSHSETYNICRLFKKMD